MGRIKLAHGRELGWGPEKVPVWGIVNVTPDSFSDGGRHADTEAAIEHGLRLLEEGADVLDIGGESTRPGAAGVPLKKEMERVLPVIHGLTERAPEAILSIDTIKPEVAHEAVELGAHIINDVAGGRGRDDGSIVEGEESPMFEVVAETGAAYCCMHMLGSPRTMQSDPKYDDVVAEVGDFFAARLALLGKAGVARDRVILDPGIGFGKTLEHNLALMGAGGYFRERFGCPVLIGASRKSMLRALTGIEEPAQRDTATHWAHLAAVARGASMLRVHDVAGACASLEVTGPILNN